MITADQISLGRKLLGWTPSVLAVKAGVTTGAVRRAEGLDAGSPATVETLAAIRHALEAAGLAFTADGQPRVGMNPVEPARMFEVWQSQNEPSEWLVFRSSTSFPGAFAVQDWIMLGECEVADWIRLDVDEQGYATIRSNVPFDATRVLGPSPEV